MEVEQIIKSKKYFELTAKELAEVSNYASNETEFDDMKSFLLSTHQTVKNQKITNTNELDDKVLNYLNQSYAQTTPWYNSVLLFLFPRDKQFYKYPAFQLTIASLFVFVAINVVNFSSFEADKMAFNNSEEYEAKEPVEIEILEEVEESVSDLKNDKIEVIEQKLEKENEMIKSELTSVPSSKLNEMDILKDLDVNYSFSFADEVVEEESEGISVFDSAPSGNGVDSRNDEADLEVDSESISELENTIVTANVRNANVENEAVSGKDKESKKISDINKFSKAKVSSSAEPAMEKIEPLPSVNKISLQSTPELLKLFFNVD